MKVLKNLVLVDETHPLNLQKIDILIDGDTIIDIVDEHQGNNVEVIEFNGQYVSPGWIDMHVHCFENATDISVDADRIGVESGVVLLCDAGSSGEATIDKFYEQVKDKKTLVKAWINIASTGLKDRHELMDPGNVNVEKTLGKIREYNDFIVGIKVRASASVMGDDTVTPFVKAKEVKKYSGKPIMVHIGNYPPTIENVLSQLQKEDIITHCFHGKPNGILDDNKIKPVVLSKRKEGVMYDVGHGQDSFSFKVATIAKGEGFYPDSISSDLHKYNLHGPVYSLANVVNKFLHLGFELNEVINWVTRNPAQMLKLKEFGSIFIGQKAHLTIFKIENEKKTLLDSNGVELSVDKVVKMDSVFVAGKRLEVKYEN